MKSSLIRYVFDEIELGEFAMAYHESIRNADGETWNKKCERKKEAARIEIDPATWFTFMEAANDE